MPCGAVRGDASSSFGNWRLSKLLKLENRSGQRGKPGRALVIDNQPVTD